MQKPSKSLDGVARAALLSLALGAAGLAGLLLSPSAQAADVGVSISISQPGVHGRIDVGRYPKPELLAPRPVVIKRPRVMPPPVYLWVPVGHQRHWSKHCSRYHACGTPVYFVKEDWYRRHVHRPPHGPAHGPVHGPAHGHSHRPVPGPHL